MFRRRPAAKPQQDQKSVSIAEMIAIQGLGAATWTGRDPASLAHFGYRGNVVAYRCVQMITEAAASVPLIVCEGMTRMADHPLMRLMGRPNADETGHTIREAIFGHLQIFGNAYIEIVGSPREPAAMFILRPDRVRMEVDRQGWPTAFLYRTAGTERRIMRRDDGSFPILHIKLFHPLDDHQGQSPLQVAANAVDLHNAAVAWNKSLIDNSARPSGALIYRGVEGAPHLTAEQFDRLKSELRETYQGARHAGRPMLLDGGLEWRPMSLSPSEMDFQELKNGAARDIALAFGVPPMLLGIPGDNTYANYQQAVLALWRQTVLPLVAKVATAFTVGLDAAPCRVDFDADAIDALIDSRTSRLDAILRADFLTDAEKRNALGFPAQADGVRT